MRRSRPYGRYPTARLVQVSPSDIVVAGDQQRLDRLAPAVERAGLPQVARVHQRVSWFAFDVDLVVVRRHR